MQIKTSTCYTNEYYSEFLIPW